MTETGTAILVDGENISPTHAPRILGAAAALAPIRLARVYGHVPRINGWTTTAGFVPVHTTRAKDGADLVLAIEAVAQAHAPGITHLVIATSDGGLAPLVHHLRAAGRSVLLLGEAKTPEALRLAASRFLMLGAPTSAPTTAPTQTTAPAPLHKAPPGLDSAIRELLLADPERAGEMSLGELGHRLRQMGFKVKDTGVASWSRYFSKRGDLCRLQGEGAAIRVRLL